MLYDALIPSLEEVGARFERGDYFVPEMLIAARAMQGALDILRPLLAETGAKPIGTYVMGTVKGDVHDIGKNLVNIMLEGAGFTVYDLGVNVAPEKFVEQINEHQPDIVGFSAFLTTTMPMFKANINALQKAGHPRRRDRHGRRCAGDAGVRRRRRRRRLRGRRVDCGSDREGSDRRSGARRFPPDGDRPRLRDEDGRHRPRPPVLRDRRAHQPDRPQEAAGRASAGRPLAARDRCRPAGRAAPTCSTSTSAIRLRTRSRSCARR